MRKTLITIGTLLVSVLLVLGACALAPAPEETPTQTEDMIAELQSQITALEEELATKKANIKALQQEIQDKQNKIEELEKENLAPYAAKSKATRGFKHPQKEAKFRTVYQRDRDRIVHSAAFRRLEYKTQVFVNHEGDYYRTRLTHTIEVVQIARSIARPLRLNEDLTESIALSHDIGHTPFGHSGEEMLHSVMKDFGGFEHNDQGFRVLD